MATFRPFITPGSRRKTNVRSLVDGSRASRPAIAERTTPQSLAALATGPNLSNDQESGMQPNRLTRPNVGLSPDAPTVAEGRTIDPPVSLPMPNAISPAVVP